MKEITIKAYQASELSDKAKDKAYYNWLESADYPYGDENKESLKAFEDAFPIKINNWSYGWQGSFVSWEMYTDHDIDELSGQRLATYLWNNYRDVIYKRKYLKPLSRDKRIYHPMVEQELSTGRDGKKHYWTTVYSNMRIETYNCPLTGYYIDNNLLDPIWKFMENPDNTTFYDLMDQCLDSWVNGCKDDFEHCTSIEYFIEEMENNDVLFNEKGRTL